MKEVYLSCMGGLKGQNQGVFRVRISNFGERNVVRTSADCYSAGLSIEEGVQGLPLRMCDAGRRVCLSRAAYAGDRASPRGAEALCGLEFHILDLKFEI